MRDEKEERKKHVHVPDSSCNEVLHVAIGDASLHVPLVEEVVEAHRHSLRRQSRKLVCTVREATLNTHTHTHTLTYTHTHSHLPRSKWYILTSRSASLKSCFELSLLLTSFSLPSKPNLRR